MSKPLKDAILVEQTAAGQPEANTRKVYTTLADLGPLKDEAVDDNVLFSGNWLGRGGGLLITASSGVGKSSLIVQSLLTWSLGKEFLARPNNGRRLKCALVQSEDSQRDLQEIRDGVIKGFTSAGWTDEEVNDAVGSMHIWNCVGKVGKDFCDWLLGQQRADPVDIIAINPIQGFFGGDISKQEDVSRFLREGLDPILKGEYGTKPCAAVLVQHTPKITATKDGNDAEVGNYGEYLGAGRHEWTDWTRANLVFLKHKGSSDFFDLQAAKRGKRLGYFTRSETAHVFRPDAPSAGEPGRNIMSLKDWLQPQPYGHPVDAGEIVRPNPLTGALGKTKNGKDSYIAQSCIAAHRHMVFEFDGMSLPDQCRFWAGVIRQDNLPLVSLVYSGNKSIHGVIRADAPDAETWDRYRQAILGLFATDADTRYRLDPQALHPLTGTRLAGVTRASTGKVQVLLWVTPKWRDTEWQRMLNGPRAGCC